MVYTIEMNFSPPKFWSTSVDVVLLRDWLTCNVLTKLCSPTEPSNQWTHQTTQSDWSLKPADSTNHAVQLNPQTNAFTKPRSPTEPSNQWTHQTTHSDWTLKPADSTNHAVQLNPQTNALNKPRSPTQHSNQLTYQTTQYNSTLKPVDSPNHAVGYEGILTQITQRSIHCHWIRNTNHDLHCSTTRDCSVSLLSQSVTRSREGWDVFVIQSCTFPGLSSCNGHQQYLSSVLGWRTAMLK